MKRSLRTALAILTWCLPLGLLVGVGVAVFLIGLEGVSGWRSAHLDSPWLLPLVGLLVGWTYDHFGQLPGAGERFDRHVSAGAEWVFRAARNEWAGQPSSSPSLSLLPSAMAAGSSSPPVPRRMAPMVVAATWLTHLGGGSAGREGTAVQTSAALARWLVASATFVTRQRQLVRAPGWLTVAAIAGGFAAAFGTPLTGAVFALERCFRRGDRASAWVEPALAALICAYCADVVAAFCLGHADVHHTQFPSWQALSVDQVPSDMPRWLALALLVALASVFFVRVLHAIKVATSRWFPHLASRLFVGGITLCLAAGVCRHPEALGLSLPLLAASFVNPVTPISLFAKVAFTWITLGFGFVGGEVTPLFVMGGLLGNLAAAWLHLPMGQAAAIAMTSLFGVALHAPIALSVMSAELFGAAAWPFAVVMTMAAALFERVLSYLLQQRAYSVKGR